MQDPYTRYSTPTETPHAGPIYQVLYTSHHPQHAMNNVNDPQNKYSTPHLEGSSETPLQAVPLLFFNHHEFLVNNYSQPIPGNTSGLSSAPTKRAPTVLEYHDKALVVSHFPNTYVFKESSTYRETRVVRIPRAYENAPSMCGIPQFSLYTPGTEPASLSAEGDAGFSALGEYDNTVFGATSVPPLVPQHISADQLREVVKNVNRYLVQALDPYNAVNVVENVLDVVSGTLYTKAVNGLGAKRRSHRLLMELEEYVQGLNADLEKRGAQIRFMSLRKGGYLSLDIQVPVVRSDDIKGGDCEGAVSGQ